ncbi:MAG TPA: molecular chaperone HtpG [Candidatus Alistipes excrementipullorum]|nr:molecular chaperone HtpG [Candidatus Alistipes excrementipullorum]
MKSGKIGVTTENIFPVIKKFLYSDHEIFLRELVSNAVDATQKLKTLSSTGTVKGELGDLTIHVAVDSAARTLTVTDRGIGMTAEEVDKYINQIAFSSAEEFLDKYKNQAIIGHFGLGFYSSFMVADKVEIFTQSYQEGAKAVRWSCNGSPEFEMEELDAARDRGTSIVLHIADDCLDYTETSTVEALLKKYCRFLPVPIAFGKVKEWKDGKYVDTDKDNIINDTDPLWTRKPTDITEEQYKEFYRELYPLSDDPLFYIHLNIDYPFHLTGILYFPKIHNNFEIQKNKIQLYSNQVYVTDQVEGIVPEYLTLLHGVIDSPDIPLNVSRSYLQSDSNVKKISSYITRKVADRLHELFTTMRAEYESKWDDLKIFIQYGILTDEKFAEKAQEFMLWKNVDGKYFTAAEYTELVKANQTDKNGNIIFLYVDDPVEKHSFLETAKAKGYDVLVLNGQLDNHYINWYESKNQNVRFVRVDSDVIEKLIQKEDAMKMSLTEAQQEIMRPVFESQLPTDEKIHYSISFEAMSPDEAPIVITQNEFMRRMKEMSAMGGGGMSQFYGQMPDNFTIAVNGNHPIVIDLLGDVEKAYGDKLKSITKKIDAAVGEEKRFEETVKDKKESDLTDEEKNMREELSKKVVTLRDERNARLREIGGQNNLVRQIIDLALLSNGMLKGKNLSDFIQRSITLIEGEKGEKK